MKLIVFIGLLLIFAHADKPSDKIVYGDWPDLPAEYNKSVNMYSGYLKSGENKNLHYMFVESQSDPERDPLLLWLNGGPSCSSMYGFFYEHGPIFYRAGSKVQAINPWSLNKYANVIYLESPVGVGWSYSTKESDYIIDDPTVAQDHLHALVDFLANFPEFRKNEFYITGESYAGHYAPYLVLDIDIWNEGAGPEKQVNLVGLILGNPDTQWIIEEDAWFDILYDRNIYDMKIRAKVEKYCKPNPLSMECMDALNDIAACLKDVNEYDIYTNCWAANDGENNQKTNYFKWRELYLQHLERTNGSMITRTLLEKLTRTPTCIDVSGLKGILKTEQMQKVLHKKKESLEWEMCSEKTLYLPDYNKGSYWLYPMIFGHGYHVLIYSGDLDIQVPTIATQRWIRQYQKDYNLRSTMPWHEWTFQEYAIADEPQVGGYAQKYGRYLTFATLKGGGHFAPQNKPQAFVEMVRRWLDGEAL